MASLTLRGLNDRFPEGTSLGAYPLSNWAPGQAPAAGTAPVGSATATASVSSDAVTLAGLADDTAYIVTDSAGTKFVRAFTLLSHGQPVKTDGNGMVPWALLAGSEANVKDAAYGAKGGAVLVTDGAISSGTAAFSSSQAALTQVKDAGKSVVIPGAGAAGVPLVTTIISVSGGVGTLAASASTTVTGATVCVGWDDTAAFAAAYASGKPIKAPQDSYLVLGQIGDGTRAIRLIGDGLRRTFIYRPSSAATKMIVPSGSRGADVNLSANVAQYARTLTLTSTTGLVAGDYILIKSDAEWNTTTSPGVKKGEVQRIQSVDSSTQVTLVGQTVDSYATVDTARVSKMNYLIGHHVEGNTFHNLTPGQGSGGTFFDFTTCAEGRVSGNAFVNGMSGNVVLDGCRDLGVEGNEFRDGSVSSPFGYGVQAVGPTIDCPIRNNRAIGGHGGIFTCSTNAGDFGVTRFCTIQGNVARNFRELPLHAHEQSESLEFIGNRCVNGGYDATFAPVIGVFGKNHTWIDNVVENCFGEAIRIDANSDGATVIGGAVRNQRAGATRNSTGVWLSGTNATVKGLLIDGVRDAAAADSGAGTGVRLNSGGTGAHLLDLVIKNTDASAISHGDATDSAIIDNVVGINNGNYVLYTSHGNGSGKARNVRGVNTVIGLTNTAKALQGNPPQRGVIAPAWGGDMPVTAPAVTLTAGFCYCARFEAPRDMRVTDLAYPLAVNAGANDTVDVAILDSAGNRLRSAGGAVAGKLNAGQGTWVSVPLTASYVLRQGVIYYFALSTVTPFGGTAAQIRGVNNANPMGDNFGATAGLRDTGGQSGVGATIGASVSVFQSAAAPFLKAIEG